MSTLLVTKLQAELNAWQQKWKDLGDFALTLGDYDLVIGKMAELNEKFPTSNDTLCAPTVRPTTKASERGCYHAGHFEYGPRSCPECGGG
jgi:hypothetical protein